MCDSYAVLRLSTCLDDWCGVCLIPAHKSPARLVKIRNRHTHGSSMCFFSLSVSSGESSTPTRTARGLRARNASVRILCRHTDLMNGLDSRSLHSSSITRSLPTKDAERAKGLAKTPGCVHQLSVFEWREFPAALTRPFWSSPSSTKRHIKVESCRRSCERVALIGTGREDVCANNFAAHVTLIGNSSSTAHSTLTIIWSSRPIIIYGTYNIPASQRLSILVSAPNPIFRHAHTMLL